jgi:hypothetical protein
VMVIIIELIKVDKMDKQHCNFHSYNLFGSLRVFELQTSG